jgi:DNA-binding LytR/AlgR family response regulator
MPKTLIIEDEKPAARRLQRMIEKNGMTVVDVLYSVSEGIHWLSRHPSPDLILADIQLSDGIFFDITDEVPLQCPVIFTTAYDKYALHSFRLNSIDYLLKPIREEELQAALLKFRKWTGASYKTIDYHSLKEDINQRKYIKRFSVQSGYHWLSLPTDNIACLYTRFKTNFIHTIYGKSYITTDSLNNLEKQLDPDFFFRVNRQCIVHYTAIDEILVHNNSRFKLVIPHFNEFDIIVARDRAKDFKKWLSQ